MGMNSAIREQTNQLHFRVILFYMLNCLEQAVVLKKTAIFNRLVDSFNVLRDYSAGADS